MVQAASNYIPVRSLDGAPGEPRRRIAKDETNADNEPGDPKLTSKLKKKGKNPSSASPLRSLPLNVRQRFLKELQESADFASSMGGIPSSHVDPTRPMKGFGQSDPSGMYTDYTDRREEHLPTPCMPLGSREAMRESAFPSGVDYTTPATPSFLREWEDGLCSGVGGGIGSGNSSFPSEPLLSDSYHVDLVFADPPTITQAGKDGSVSYRHNPYSRSVSSMISRRSSSAFSFPQEELHHTPSTVPSSRTSSVFPRGSEPGMMNDEVGWTVARDPTWSSTDSHASRGPNHACMDSELMRMMAGSGVEEGYRGEGAPFFQETQANNAGVFETDDAYYGAYMGGTNHGDSWYAHQQLPQPAFGERTRSSKTASSCAHFPPTSFSASSNTAPVAAGGAKPSSSQGCRPILTRLQEILDEEEDRISGTLDDESYPACRNKYERAMMMVLPHANSIAVDLQASHVMKTLIEQLPTNYVVEMLHCLYPSTIFKMCTGSQHTRKLIQLIMERHNGPLLTLPLFQVLASDACHLAATQQGCIIIKNALQQGSLPQQHLLLPGLLPYLPKLAVDPYANYVVQVLIEEQPGGLAIDDIFNALGGANSAVGLSCNKGGSNVMEKLVKAVSGASRQALVDEFISCRSNCHKLLMNCFGNFVLQALIESSHDMSEFQMIYDMIALYLLNSPYGQKIGTKLRGKYVQLYGVEPPARATQESGSAQGSRPPRRGY